MPIVWSIIVLGGLGAVFGIILGVASKKFAVKVDERVSAVRDLLPGANCGGCGFPGCDGFANTLVAGKAEITTCAVLNADSAKQIAEVLGVSAGDVKPKVARIMCLGSNGNCQDKFIYDGAQDCRAAYAIASGFRNCRFSCLGLGTCAKVCKFGAIKMGDHGIAAIDEDKCTGCGRCVEQCPQISIAIQDKEINVYAACTNVDKGKAVTTVCSAGCIGCAKCQRTCPFEAITMDRGLPIIDYTKCRQCKMCVDACPRMCIVTTKPDKVAHVIEENCIGCGLCKKACAFEAIEGELKQKHVVNKAKCRGCGLCFEKCKKKAIEFKVTGKHVKSEKPPTVAKTAKAGEEQATPKAKTSPTASAVKEEVGEVAKKPEQAEQAVKAQAETAKVQATQEVKEEVAEVKAKATKATQEVKEAATEVKGQAPKPAPKTAKKPTAKPKAPTSPKGEAKKPVAKPKEDTNKPD